jgi:hypothetical protein
MANWMKIFTNNGITGEGMYIPLSVDLGDSPFQRRCCLAVISGLTRQRKREREKNEVN